METTRSFALLLMLCALPLCFGGPADTQNEEIKDAASALQEAVEIGRKIVKTSGTSAMTEECVEHTRHGTLLLSGAFSDLQKSSRENCKKRTAQALEKQKSCLRTLHPYSHASAVSLLESMQASTRRALSALQSLDAPKRFRLLAIDDFSDLFEDHIDEQLQDDDEAEDVHDRVGHRT